MKKKIEDYIIKWKTIAYFKDIPDKAPKRLEELKKVPSYRAICLAILKNDSQLKSLGFTPKSSRYYSMLKRKELEEKGIIAKQWRLDL